MNGDFEIAPAGIVAFVTEMHEFVAQTHTLVETPRPGFLFCIRIKPSPLCIGYPPADLTGGMDGCLRLSKNSDCG